VVAAHPQFLEALLHMPQDNILKVVWGVGRWRGPNMTFLCVLHRCCSLCGGTAEPPAVVLSAEATQPARCMWLRLVASPALLPGAGLLPRLLPRLVPAFPALPSAGPGPPPAALTLMPSPGLPFIPPPPAGLGRLLRFLG
jgi:hypothetical protein